jgi:hypothetical protein
MKRSLQLHASPAPLPAGPRSGAEVTPQLKDYSGNGAYLAIYVTDGNGYQKTLWVAGKGLLRTGDWPAAG